jgi:phosphate transport system substrate-binding protein
VNRNSLRRSLNRAIAPTAVAASLAFTLAACGGGQQAAQANGDGASGSVAVDGSSTVFPLSDAAAELLSQENSGINVTVATSGTGGGFEAFCSGKTDISNASRPIKEEEVAICEKNGIELTELPVATDALTVVVHPDLAVDCLTTEQLSTIWSPESQGKVDSWRDVDPSFPDQDLTLFGPGTDSGTFDYFTEEINGEEGASRSDYEASEEDTVLVEGVANTEGATGYFGYTYFEENAEKLKAVAVDSGEGCVEPSVETAQSGEYSPLARPLYIYVANKSYTNKPAVKEYVDFYISNLTDIAEAAEYIPLNDEQLSETSKKLEGIA